MNTHKFILYTLLSTLTMVSLGGCRKDVEEIRPYSYTVGEIKTLLKQVPNSFSTTVFVLRNLATDTSLLSPGGVRISLVEPENLFANASGAVVPCSTCDYLEVRVTPVMTKGDWLSRGLGTLSANGKLLETGGMVYITASCNGQPLTLLSGKTLTVNLPVSPDDLKNDLLVGEGVFSSDTVFSGWTLTPEPVFWAQWQSQNSGILSGYELRTGHLGWNGAFHELSEPPANFCVELPAPHNAQNSIALLIFDNINTALPLESTDPRGNTFCSDKIPAGYPVRVVVVGKYSGQYWLDSQSTETGTNTLVQTIVPEPLPEAEVVQFFKNL